MILYQYPGGAGVGSVSPPCLKIWLALRNLGVEHRVVDCMPRRAQQVSRTGRLPVLDLDDGTRVHESVTILDALEERLPDAELFPKDPQERAHDRLWDHYFTDSVYWIGFYMRWVHPEMAPLTFRALFGRFPAPVRPLLRATVGRRARKRARMHGVGGMAPEAVERAIERAFETIATGLAGGPFLGGRAVPGRGDLSCAALIAQVGFRGTMPKILERMQRYPELSRHCIAVHEACRSEPPHWLRSSS
jgi:glutathione S-transferase